MAGPNEPSTVNAGPRFIWFKAVCILETLEPLEPTIKGNELEDVLDVDLLVEPEG